MARACRFACKRKCPLSSAFSAQGRSSLNQLSGFGTLEYRLIISTLREVGIYRVSGSLHAPNSTRRAHPAHSDCGRRDDQKIARAHIEKLVAGANARLRSLPPATTGLRCSSAQTSMSSLRNPGHMIQRWIGEDLPVVSVSSRRRTPLFTSCSHPVYIRV